MSKQSPPPILPDESRRRRSLVLRTARSMGFVGRVEYRHVFSQSGGAQYGRGVGEGGDLLAVYAEAFERDADPEDFSLAAIIAHERGHQLIARHPRLVGRMAGVSPATEEVLASLLGALVLGHGPDRNALRDKATFDLLIRGATAAEAQRIVENLSSLLEAVL